MEKRKFGQTGLETSVLGFGGFHLVEIPAKEAEYLLLRYLDAGGNYIETAARYGDGESELKIGRVMATHRQDCILACKSHERDKYGCINSVENSLHNLKTDYLDLLLMHAVGSVQELNTILGPGGALEGVHQLKQEGKVGWVGISMHGQPDVLIRAIQEYHFDAVMTTINYYDRFNFPEIEEALLPLANAKKMAVILMKPVADGLLWRSAPVAFKYALNQPVSVVVTGMNTREILEEDLRYANEFTSMTSMEMTALFQNAVELGDYVCRQCNHCLPCPVGVPIPEIFKYEGYYDRQMRDGKVRDAAEFALRDRLRFWFTNQELARERYAGLQIKADVCHGCGECLPRCPYGIDIPRKLEIANYKLVGGKIY